MTGAVSFHGASVPPDSLLEDVVAGLSLARKQLAPKYFYDAAGSELFERICDLPEYYPTRAETELTRVHLEAIAAFAGENVELIEFGSGASSKTRILIERLRPSVYVPIDISEAALRPAVQALAGAFPSLDIQAVVGDFARPLTLPSFDGRRERKIVYFPGSTIGNLTPEEALAFLRMTRGLVGTDGAMLVGVDLKKDANVLHAAYNDSQGVTAAFNLNLLKRINRELGGDFDLSTFSHYAFYDPQAGRIEMHLVSLERQTVRVGRHRFSFDAGESIHTENSCKYSVEEFRALAAEAGFAAREVWFDSKRQFSLHGLRAA